MVAAMVLTAARMVLAAVFVTAAARKASDWRRFERSLREFRLPAALHSPVAYLIPLVELGIAIGLISTTLARPAAIAAIVLLSLFTAVIVAHLLLGKKPTCGCFGGVNAAPIGTRTVVRNAALIGVAGLVLSDGEADVVPGGASWVDTVLTARTLGIGAAALLATLVVVEGWFILNLLGQQGRLLLRMEALERAATQQERRGPEPALLAEPRPLPRVALPDTAGRKWTLDEWREPGRSLLVLFTDEDCGTCRDLLPRVLEADRDGALGIDVAVVSRQPPASPGTRILVDAAGVMADQFGITGVPSAVLVDGDGRVSYEVASGPQAISALLRRVESGRPSLAMRDPFVGTDRPVAEPVA